MTTPARELARLRDPLSDLGYSPDAAAEARSPPGQWRLLAVALLCWAMASWAICSPGRGGIIAILAAVVGGLAMTVWRLRRFGGRSGADSFGGRGDHGDHESRGGHRGHSKSWPTTAVTMIALLCGCLALLGARVHVLEVGRAAPSFQRAAAEGQHVTFEARLSGFPEKKRTSFGDREWVRIEAFVPVPQSGSTGPDAMGPGTAGSGMTGSRIPMLLWLSDAEIDWRAARWGPGTRLRVTAKLSTEPPSSLSAYTANPSSLRELRESEAGPVSALDSALGSAAATFRALLVQHATGIAGAELVPGFAVGDTSLVSETLGELMLESSLSHLTAVSGSNTGLVVAAMSWCVSRLGAGRRLRILVSGAALAVFVLVVGPDSSVLRAAVMAAVLLAGSFGGRRATALPALGLAILTLLAFDPWQALQAGFALSVAATLGILLLAEPTSRWLRKRARLPRLLALPFAVALAAQLSCGPLLLLLQPGVPAVGVVANLIAAPAAPLGTGLGLIAAILGPLSPNAATLTIHFASIPASWVASTAEVCASLPAGRWNWPDGWPGALLLAACQLALLTAWALATGRIGLPFGARVALRRPWHARLAPPPQIRATIAFLTSAAVAVFVAVTLLYPAIERMSAPADWLLVACDVGQGDALLARNPDAPDSVILIDTGDDPEALKGCLRGFGVQRISLLVLTHDDRDHVGALASVSARVDMALIAPTVAGKLTEQRSIVRELSEANVPYRIGGAGEQGTTGTDDGAGVAWRILAPPSDAVFTDTNAASLVLLFEIDGHRVLMLADTGYDEQARLLLDAGTSAELAGVEIIKVAHHGSRDQDAALYEQVGARWGLVSVGADNRYGHPNGETLGALARAGTQALRTDDLGHVALVRQPNDTLSVWVERGQ